MAINRLRVTWAGTGPVGVGLSTFYFTGTMTGRPAAVLSFFDALKANVPSGLTWDIPNSGDVIDESTGVLTGGWSASGGGQVVGVGTGAYAAGCGARFVWNTNAVFLGRRVRGSTFLVPITAAFYDTSGTLTSALVTAWQSAAATLISATSPDFKVWSRPRPGGQYATSQVQSGSVPDKVSTLRSRRT